MGSGSVLLFGERTRLSVLMTHPHPLVLDLPLGPCRVPDKRSTGDFR